MSEDLNAGVFRRSLGDADQPAQQVPESGVRGGGLVLVTHDRLGHDVLGRDQELLHQPGLADAGLAQKLDDAAVAGAHPL